MTTIDAGETIIQEIAINAPARRIFEALTDPDQRKAWWGAEGRFQTTHVESDLRVGGKWRMSGTGMGGPFTVAGEYLTVEPPWALAFTWLPSWQPNATKSLVRFDLNEKDGITTVRVTHSGLTPEGAQAHSGWPQILGWLKAYAEPGRS
ncbi:MAG: SRPBCC domain-containing protein [Alphaproteobacteria bacterium]|nr:SRPBCC domain-containing protein [Alphaproteobacteria bacterium]MBV8410505.1 SRPBCC domain-containing protein [Alphaproteobacteria bacterium]